MDLGTLLKPVENFLFNKPPQAALPLAERMRRNMAQPGPADERPAVHSQDGSRFVGVEDLYAAIIRWRGFSRFLRNGKIILRNRHTDPRFLGFPDNQCGQCG